MFPLLFPLALLLTLVVASQVATIASLRADAPRAEAMALQPVAPGFSLGYQETYDTSVQNLGYGGNPVAPGFSLGYEEIYDTPHLSVGYQEASAPPQPQLTIGSDTIWTLVGSPYVITENVTVSAGVTLTVEAGVVVKFNDGIYMQVDGTLIARGTASQPITFTSSRITPTAGSWAYIEFTDSSVDASFDGSGNYVGGSILQYAVVEYAGSSGSGAVWLVSAAPFIDRSTIRNNSLSGIYASNSSGLKITGNTISGNTASYNGGGISAGSGTATISGNTISGNTASSSGGGISAVASTVTISGNTISGNAAGNGGGIYAYHGSKAIISGNTISGNTASNGGGIIATQSTVTITINTISGNTANYGGGGIYATLSTSTISGNTIYSNTASNGGGIYAIGSTSTISGNRVAGNAAPSYAGISSNATVVTNSIVANRATSGSGSVYVFYSPTFQCNTVVSNTAATWAGVGTYGDSTAAFDNNNLYGNTSYEAYNLSSSAIIATSNWWGTTDSSVISSEVYDFFDDVSKGIVSYSPYLTAPAPCAPPSPPTGLGATPGSGSLRLSWNANPEGDMAGYRIYWDTDSGFPYANVITAGNTTAYTLTSLTGGITYFVAVTAYDTTGDESWYSEEVFAQPAALSPPTADFLGSPTSGKIPLAVTFTDTSSGTSITSWLWSFGDGVTGTLQNPTHTYSSPGVYTVSLTATNADGSDTKTRASYISVTADANFIGFPTSGRVPLTVQLTDTTTGSVSSRLWDFGDGVTSTAQNPTHTYAANGVYTISLTLTDTFGLSDKETKTSYISVTPDAEFTASPTSGPIPLTVQFTDTTTGSVSSRLWSFGPPGAETSTAPNPTFTYTSNGVFTVSLTVTDTFGLSDKETKTNLITAISADLVIQLAFQGGSYGTDRYVNPIKVTLAASPAISYVATTTNTGVLTLSGIQPGTYTITTAGPHALANRKSGVVVSAPSTSVDMGTLKEGNANMDSQVNIQDFGVLAKHYLAVGNADACRSEFLDWIAAGGTPWMKTASTYNCWTDFDKSGQTNISDFGLLTGSYLQTGPVHLP
ncbi:MAG: PKD domain-containing protein [Chloroflexi bacterium]|nr:PKD domain-containing protein [Chloroflexota bacterium]